MKRIGSVVALAAASAVAAGPAAAVDLGMRMEQLLRALSVNLFGVLNPVQSSALASGSAATAEANPLSLVTMAQSLQAKVVTAAANAGSNIDMMAPWPDDAAPTHLIVCNEQGTAQPGVQRIRLSDGLVETILTGTSACDPAPRTPWGTVIVGEEVGGTGQLIEIANPLVTTNVVFDRIAGTASGGVGAENVVSRRALGRLAFEGLAIYESGVVYYGDENRPSQGTAGGAYFKFVPSVPWAGGPPITDLNDSPLASGSVFGMRLGRRAGNTDYGQGSNTGLGVWVSIPGSNVDLRAAAAALKLTGYYRPEDLAIDLAAQAAGQVRFCGNNTGNEIDDQNYGETVCITDGTLAESLANTAQPELQYLVVGYPDFAMMDNVAYQPGRGNWLINEDGDGPEVGRNNDIFSCLDDGPGDPNLLSDGCVRVLTLNDLLAETTGGVFDASGSRYWGSIPHNATGHGVVLGITGWQ